MPGTKLNEFMNEPGRKERRKERRDRQRGQEGGREELTGVFEIKQSVTGKRRILTDFFIVS